MISPLPLFVPHFKTFRFLMIHPTMIVIVCHTNKQISLTEPPDHSSIFSFHFFNFFNFSWSLGSSRESNIMAASVCMLLMMMMMIKQTHLHHFWTNDSLIRSWPQSSDWRQSFDWPQSFDWRQSSEGAAWLKNPPLSHQWYQPIWWL